MYRLRIFATLIFDVVRTLLSPRRVTASIELHKQTVWLLADRLPSVYPREILPGIDQVEVTVDVDVGHPFELPCGERTVLAAILKCVQAKTVFEIGTYTGTTTRIMADAIEGVVHTLDLPAGENVWEPDIIQQIGIAFRERPEYEGRVVQHLGNSRTFDFSPWHGAIDLMYIDGSHEFEDVLADSREAFKMVRSGGVVVWDDYQPATYPVAEALNVLGREFPIKSIAGTRLAFYVKP